MSKVTNLDKVVKVQVFYMNSILPDSGSTSRPPACVIFPQTSASMSILLGNCADVIDCRLVWSESYTDCGLDPDMSVFSDARESTRESFSMESLAGLGRGSMRSTFFLGSVPLWTGEGVMGSL